MRFIKDGPQIPNELLLARDQGRVVFFCGAGVSRAKADLPDFFGLTEQVIKNLGVLDDDPVRRLLDEAYSIGERTDIDGLISADRMFGLIEKDFLSSEIINEVASTLRPKESTDLSSHEILLDLATTPDGRVQLVTTNFDRLFDDCGRDLPSWQPPRLPNPERVSDMHGTVYLHGKVNDDYSGSEGDGLVLSSSDFGKAYLAEGWATQFFKDVIENYEVIFVGYSADDPPVQYLLEALNSNGSLKGVYAFQSTDNPQSVAKWGHKGVTALPYSPNNGHSALWETLEAWSSRAKDIDAWYSKVIATSQKLPQDLEPHERGQVAHVVSTTEGAKRFSCFDTPPKAEWLAVFDANRRYAPKVFNWGSEQVDDTNAFDLFQLDSDNPPIEERNPRQPNTPENAWDAFQLNDQDRREVSIANISHLRGYYSEKPAELSERLKYLSEWVAKVAEQPSTIWWAVKQNGLHPELKRQIRFRIKKCSNDNIRKCWHHLTEHSLLKSNDQFHPEVFSVEHDLEQAWNNHTIKRYMTLFKPYLKVSEGYKISATPPSNLEVTETSDLVRVDVEYPYNNHNILNPPDEWLPLVIQQARKNLIEAIELESEAGRITFCLLESIEPTKNLNSFGESSHGITRQVRLFSRWFSKLIELDITAARNELFDWPQQESEIFPMLTIWAMKFKPIATSEELEKYFVGLNDEVFWNTKFKADLLKTLATRWNCLSAPIRQKLEERFLNGAPHYNDDESENNKRAKARHVLTNLHWLVENGCELNLDINQLTIELKKDDPDWKIAYTSTAIEPSIRSITHVPNQSCEELVNISAKSILSTAEELNNEREFGKSKAPFRGLVKERPVKSFLALRLAMKDNCYPEWAWNDFLYSEIRKNDKPRFSFVIAQRLLSLSNEDFALLISKITFWFSSASDSLAEYSPDTFHKLLLKCLDSLTEYPYSEKNSASNSTKELDLITQAINSPVGNLAELIFEYKAIKDKTSDEVRNEYGGFPSDWLSVADKLLDLPAKLREYSLATLFSRNLTWLNAVDPVWTQNTLLRVLSSSKENEKNAVYKGFFSKYQMPNYDLYKILKIHSFDIALRSYDSVHGKVLTAFILAGWFNEESDTTWVSSNELRGLIVKSDESFRSDLLFQLKHWIDEGDAKCIDKLPLFLKDVWPRHLSVRTPAISIRLFGLICSNKENFLNSFKRITPMLTKIDQSPWFSTKDQASKEIMNSYPDKFLTLLTAILPKDNLSVWPYETSNIIELLIEADSSLSVDHRLVELKRSWDDRYS